jgi:hypothetical protein
VSGSACQRGILTLIVLALIGAGCASGTPAGETLPAPEALLPAKDAVEGWAPAAPPETYSRETLFDFMNGAADLYFAYGFESLAVGPYKGPGDAQAQVEVYRTATDADAFGLYAYNAYGDPVELGVEGRLASGQGLAFWQRRTFVQILGAGQVDDADLFALGEAISKELPAGGERPALVGALPETGRQPPSVRFFREQVALDNYLWLGPENVLNLGPQVEGVLAEYALEDGAVRLILIEYESEDAAAAALAALQGAEVPDLVAAEHQGSVLGAVVGAAGERAGTALLAQALRGVE